MDKIRRVAAHNVIVDDSVFNLSIVEIVEGRVVNYYEFHEEMPIVEWLGNTIVIRRDKLGRKQAWWLNNGKEKLLG